MRIISRRRPEIYGIGIELHCRVAAVGERLAQAGQYRLGLVPLDPLGRTFRDLLGIAHQRLVARSDEAWFMVAGRPIALLPPPAS